MSEMTYTPRAPALADIRRHLRDKAVELAGLASQLECEADELDARLTRGSASDEVSCYGDELLGRHLDVPADAGSHAVWAIATQRRVEDLRRLAARLRGEATRLLAMDEALAFPAEIQAEQGQAEQVEEPATLPLPVPPHDEHYCQCGQPVATVLEGEGWLCATCVASMDRLSRLFAPPVLPETCEAQPQNSQNGKSRARKRKER